MKWKSLTLDDLAGQYCNRNCVSCSKSSLLTELWTFLFVV